ncbi:hypothetical protein [Methanococcoides sp. AM1]|uniref:hypothetical protein n=1 Tax=Methanococcoides sp. AM1 TaxID=1201011 RepID=UPI00143857E2|nr:hypothetical protein [Methanococcoides sp. AM1]
MVVIVMIAILCLLLLTIITAVPKLQVDGAVLIVENKDIADHGVRLEMWGEC